MNINLTKKVKAKAKQEKVIELLKEKNWELVEGADNVWSYKFNDYHKNTEGLVHLNIHLEMNFIGGKGFELKLVEENEEKTKRDYRLVFSDKAKIRDLDHEVGGLLYSMERSRSDWKGEIAERNRLNELQQLGFTAYIDKKITENFANRENDDEEDKLRRQRYSEIAKEQLLKYQWRVGSWNEGFWDEMKKIEEVEKSKFNYFDIGEPRGFIEEVREDWWKLHRDNLENTVKKIGATQSDKYQKLVEAYRNDEISNKDFYNELGRDINKEHSNYSVEDLGECYGKDFLKEQIKEFVQKEFKARKTWTQQQWKDYYPREDYGSYEEIGVRELSTYDISKFVEDKQYTSEDFDKENEGKYSDNEEGWKKKYYDWKKEVLNRLKSVKNNIFENKNFTYPCSYCNSETKSWSEYRFVARTKHNIIYTCSRCENSDYYIIIKNWERKIRMEENARG